MSTPMTEETGRAILEELREIKELQLYHSSLIAPKRRQRAAHVFNPADLLGETGVPDIQPQCASSAP